MSYPFQNRQVYSFDVYPLAALGNNFKNVTVMAVMDAETAAQSIDIQAQHVAYFPFLPAGTPNDPRAYDYVKIKTLAGNTAILGLAWINEATIVQVESVTIVATVYGAASSDVTKIRNALIQNGFNNVSVLAK